MRSDSSGVVLAHTSTEGRASDERQFSATGAGERPVSAGVGAAVPRRRGGTTAANADTAIDIGKISSY